MVEMRDAGLIDARGKFWIVRSGDNPPKKDSSSKKG